MSAEAWAWIAAGRALRGDDPRYVARPDLGGDAIAALVERDLAPLAVAGPPGSGRSTELLRAAWRCRERSQDRVVDLTWFGDPERLEVGPFLYHLARHYFEEWAGDPARKHPTVALVQDMRASDPDLPQGSGRTLPPLVLARQVFEGYATAYGIRRLAIFVDGFERVSPERAARLLVGLADVADVADVVVAVGPRLSHGPEAFALLERFRVVPLAALDTAPRSAGRAFFRELVLRRLPPEAKTRALLGRVDRAAALSGGLPRRALALLGDAARYAPAGVPTAASLERARADHEEALRRLLIAGDRAELARALGTDGMEVAADRRVRLLAHGLLLERGVGPSLRVTPHPLLEGWLRGGRDEALAERVSSALEGAVV